MSINPKSRVSRLLEMEFQKLADFNQGQVGVFWSEPGGPSPWEMHPDTDEMLYILEGAINVEVLPIDGSEGETNSIRSGEFCIIPRGCWHRHFILEKTQELYITPGATMHSIDADPR